MTRTAISPRFAISTLENTVYLRPMSLDRAKAALAGTRFADLRWVAETGSTNADLPALLAEAGVGGQPFPPVVLVADDQRAGRGRLDRTWESAPGSSLLLSIGFGVEDVPAERRTLLAAAVGVAAADALEGTRIKWPNDLVVDGPASGTPLKVGGILAELVDAGSAGSCVVVGLGVNLNWETLPAELEGIATSMNLVLGGEVDREVVLVDLLVGLDERWLPLVTSAGADIGEFADAYRARSATLGGRVRVELPDAVLVGTAVDIEPNGALGVEDDQRVRRSIDTGDVVHLRPHAD
jgi:BirA family biotin operon repressor/biotin-[acetyl-CoA-carboxylase] ligase